MTTDRGLSRQRAVPRIWKAALRIFTAYARRYVKKRFHSVRVLASAAPAPDCEGPLVVYLNHASWWDPLICMLLANRYFPNRQIYAPMDAASLERYRFFRNLGFFGIDLKSTAAGLSFVRMAREILKTPGASIWMTAQGDFTDMRVRPPGVRPVTGLLAQAQRGTVFLPLAIEYTFWTEPRPEALVAFGTPFFGRESDFGDAREITAKLDERLAQVQDLLSEKARVRNLADWETIDRGSGGVNPMYDAWRWFRCLLNGRDFTAAHNAETR